MKTYGELLIENKLLKLILDGAGFDKDTINEVSKYTEEECFAAGKYLDDLVTRLTSALTESNENMKLLIDYIDENEGGADLVFGNKTEKVVIH